MSETLFNEKEVKEQQPKNAIVKQQKPQQLISVEQLLMAAIEKGVDADALTKLLDLKERIDSKNAEMAFNEAMSKFQESCPVIKKATAAKDGNKIYFKYAALEDIAPIIQKPLGDAELSYSFDADIIEKEKGNIIKVICTVKHVLGHERTATFTGPVDAGTARMNNIQKVNSAITYGRRTSLMLALGLIAAGEDDDGKAADTAKTISEKQKEEIEKLIGNADEKLYTKILEFYQVENLDMIPADSFQQCINKIKTYQEKKKTSK